MIQHASALFMIRLWLLLLFFSWVFAARADLADQLYQDALHILGGNANVVSKWQGEIRLAVISDNDSADFVEKASAIVSEAAEIAGLPLSPALQSLPGADYLTQLQNTPSYWLGSPCVDNDRESCVNFAVIITNPTRMLALAEAIPLRPLYQEALRQSPDLECFFAPYHKGALRIVQTVVYVRNDLPKDLLTTCLQEEIYQSFGLYNDASGSTLFSFNNVVAAKQITQYDKALLKALYDERVKPGYPAAMVVEIFLDSLKLPE